MPELHLRDERKLLVPSRLDTARYVKSRPSTTRGHLGTDGELGTYNSGTLWQSDVAALPSTRTVRVGGTGLGGTGSAGTGRPLHGQWGPILGRSARAEELDRSGRLPSLADPAAAPAPGTLHAQASFLRAERNLLRGDGALLTTEGLRRTRQLGHEAALNDALAGGGGGRPALTLGDHRTFADFCEGQGTMSRQRGAAAGPALLAAMTADAGASAALRGTERFKAQPSAVRAWASALPPSPATLEPSALQELRTRVRSAVSTQRPFRRMHRPLTSHFSDSKTALGAPLDLALPLERVEPVRPTAIMPQADYVAWADYSLNCPSAPPRWFNEHPAALAQY